MSYLPMGVSQDQLDRYIEDDEPMSEVEDEMDVCEDGPELWREDEPMLMPEPTGEVPEPPEIDWERFL